MHRGGKERDAVKNWIGERYRTEIPSVYSLQYTSVHARAHILSRTIGSKRERKRQKKKYVKGDGKRDASGVLPTVTAVRSLASCPRVHAHRRQGGQGKSVYT